MRFVYVARGSERENKWCADILLIKMLNLNLKIKSNHFWGPMRARTIESKERPLIVVPGWVLLS